mmetsp:Transcript_24359/g.96594  ORF Transcript_24359/g.96594 Transcript_24359/m.96594 type:complete len:306 (-) Transcript_24359:1362-2279(-)
MAPDASSKWFSGDDPRCDATAVPDHPYDDPANPPPIAAADEMPPRRLRGAGSSSSDAAAAQDESSSSIELLPLLGTPDNAADASSSSVSSSSSGRSASSTSSDAVDAPKGSSRPPTTGADGTPPKTPVPTLGSVVVPSVPRDGDADDDDDDRMRDAAPVSVSSMDTGAERTAASMRRFTLAGDDSSAVASSTSVGSRALFNRNCVLCRCSRTTSSCTYIGSRMSRDWHATQRSMACRIQWKAYVENLYPRPGSYFSAAHMSPMEPSCTRSENPTPRPSCFLAITKTSRMFDATSACRADRPASTT